MYIRMTPISYICQWYTYTLTTLIHHFELDPATSQHCGRQTIDNIFLHFQKGDPSLYV